MATPNRKYPVLPGQMRISGFLHPMLHTPATAEHSSEATRYEINSSPSPPTTVNQKLPLKRRRKIDDTDDDCGGQTAPTNAKPATLERIQVHDTADESDTNFAVMLLPTPRVLPAINQTQHSTPIASNPEHRRMRRKRLHPQTRETTVRTIY
jgi:hypothetical protein